MQIRIAIADTYRATTLSRRATEVLVRYDLQQYCAACTGGFVAEDVAAELADFEMLGALLEPHNRVDPYTIVRMVALSGAQEVRLRFRADTVIITVLHA